MSFHLVLVIALAGISLLFIIQNVAAVDVTFLLWSVSMSRALLIIITLATGFLLGWFLHSYYSYRTRKVMGISKDEG
jgi:uncharacterized integral membrane protein